AAYLGRPGATAAATLYSATFFCIALVYNALWRHASRDRRLLDSAASPAAIAEIDRSYRFGPPLYGLAFLLAFVNLTASLLTCLALAVFFSITGSRSRREQAGSLLVPGTLPAGETRPAPERGLCYPPYRRKGAWHGDHNS